MPDTKETCPTYLLADAPTRQDAFGHSKVAEAIAELVTTENGAKCIGLTGSWGSGKSSVVEILREKLTKADGANCAEFVFDAWAHQGDPLRRSFLEQLIDKLVSIEWLKNPNEWKERKQELARRVEVTNTTSQPQLTTLGGIFALTVLLLPLAYQLFVQYPPKDSTHPHLWKIALFLILLPPLEVAAAWVAWRPTWKIWRGAFWTTHRKPHNKKSLLALFLNKSQERTESNTIRTPDPTSVEFQQLFGELMGDALQSPNRRLLIVVDNLDRIDVRDALAIWATLQTFFDFEAHGDTSFLNRLWLLLPFDETAIRKLWTRGESPSTSPDTGSDDSLELARSFVDKTFQITFRVAPPVLSDWHEFLKRQLKVAFPNHTDEEFHKIYRIYDLCAVTASRAPTPRDIKLFVNRVGAIHRLWQDEITLAVQALYVLLSRKGRMLAEDLALKKDEEILGNVPNDMVGRNWREGLAAIHFNVRKDRALQVVIGGQIKDALMQDDGETFKKLAAIPGFTGVLEKQMEASSPNWAKGETRNLAIAASLVATVPAAEDPSLARTWNLLRRGAEGAGSWLRFDERSADGIIQIFRRFPDTSLLTALMGSVTKSIHVGTVAEPADINAWLDGVFAILRALKTDYATTIHSSLMVPGSSAEYITTMDVASTRVDDGELLSYLRPQASRRVILDQINKVVADGNFEGSFLRIVNAMRNVEGDWPWDKLIESASGRLKTTTGMKPTELRALLETLFGISEAKDNLADLARGGFISLHLQYTLEDPKATALCMIPMLEAVPDGNIQAVPHAFSRTGVNTYNEILGDQRETVLAPFCDYVAAYNKFDLLYDAPARAGRTAPFCYAALKRLAEAENAFEHFPPARIIGNQEQLRTALGGELFDGLIIKSVAKSSLAAALVTHGFSPDLARLYGRVLDLDGHNTAYIEFLIAGAKSLDKSAWLSALMNENELLDLLVKITGGGSTMGLGVEFEDALVDHARQLAEGKSKVERLPSRWDAIFESLEHHLQDAALGKILEILFTSREPTDAILDLYGAKLHGPSLLSDIADRVVLILFPKFIERLRVAELQWCCKVLESNPNLLTEVSESTRTDLAARLIGAGQQQATGAEVQTAVQKLASLAGVNLAKAAKEPEEKPIPPEEENK
jgi:hypothetical protein